jgi:sugar (pentulose or hexulose) kinase
MGGPRTVGVIDIGKSNAKFALVDLEHNAEIAVRKMPNRSLMDGPYPHYDIDGLWDFLCAGIAALNREHRIDALCVTTHGASAALVDADGKLALPVLDYEFVGPDELAREYNAVRPEFSESFTPRLPVGLNLGAQLFWQAHRFPEAFARTKWILPYPQYWGFRLTGMPASEVTSLGCHTDLWNFETGLYSSLVMRERWIDKMPEVRPAAGVLGPLKPEIAAKLGLRPETPVLVGIHDSNASLLPHLIGRTPPFSVVSTGTWVIACTPGGDLGALDPARDCLANIDAFGRPVPSARFMGGREFELLTHGQIVAPSASAVAEVFSTPVMLLPSVQQGSGPFPHRAANWYPSEVLPETRFAPISFYLALMTAECLGMTGGEGDIVVEGPFAGNPLYLQMLAAASGRPVLAGAASATGTSIGAAMLATKRHTAAAALLPVQLPEELAAPMQRYAAIWRKKLGIVAPVAATDAAQ